METATLDRRSLDLRKLMVEMFDAGRRGHLGSAFSSAEILRVLYDDVLVVDPARPQWEDRDRFIMSKGHGCLALYAMLIDKGFVPRAETMSFCASDGLLGGHPDHHITGVELSTGSLGHGLAVGVGMALAARIAGRRNRVFVLMGDGETNEGSVWEAAIAASKHGLSRLVAIVDANGMQSYGKTTDVSDMEPMAEKWRSFGFAVREVDGHDVAALQSGLDPDETATQPLAVICRTVKGKGIPMLEGNAAWHHRRGVTDPEMAALYAALEDQV